MRPRRPPPDPYAILGVAPGASRAEIGRAYRRRAVAIHPDIAGPAGTEAMALLNRARDELLARVSTASRSPAGSPVTRDPAPARERPGWAAAHDSAWTDHWAAWNEPRRRD